ncbi:hypothetical protein WA577_000515, partial [Blastocystis sp. JDR]
MLKKRGHINIKLNQRVKDKNGNLSEFDIVYGWPVRHYVECKNYSHPVKLEMVAKFKEVLRLHHIPKSRGLFVTTSTYTPRATTIGITCIDGAGLERLEKTALTALITKYLIILCAAAGGYGLYYYLLNTDSKKVKAWRDTMDERSRQISKQSVEKVQEVGSAVLATSTSVASDAKDVVVESVSKAVSSVKDAVMEKPVAEGKPAEKSAVAIEKSEKSEEEDVWEAPS